MYIIFNKDGSIKERQLNDYINKGSDGVNFIDVVVYDNEFKRWKNPNEYSASGSFLLPDGHTALTATPTHNNAITTSLGVFEGYRFTLYEAFTQQAGTLKFSLSATSDDGTAVSFAIDFTVNETAIYKDTTITWEEYEALLKTLKDYQLQYSASNVRAYFDTQSDIPDDWDSLASDQYYLINELNDEADTVELRKKSLGNTQIAIAKIGNRPYFVYTDANNAPEGVIQSVGTGLHSAYSKDGYTATHGTALDESGLPLVKAEVKKGETYAGSIELGARDYAFYTINMGSAKAFWAKVTSDYADLRSPMGTSSILLENGKITIDATNISLGSSLYTDGSDWYFKDAVVNFDGMAFFSHAEVAATPSTPTEIANKGYVDDCINTEVLNRNNAISVSEQRCDAKEAYLQSQIDAINAGQNFVATVATYERLIDLDTTKLDKADCVLVLKDETHGNQSSVYRYTGKGSTIDTLFEFVGELGDYYTKSQIDEMHTTMENEVDGKLGTMETAYKSYVGALFVETASDTTASE